MEVNNPGKGLTLVLAVTGVYNAAAPVGWTDLDISAVVGAAEAIVRLRIEADGLGDVAVRKNGDTNEYFQPAGAAHGEGLQSAYQTTIGRFVVLEVETDGAGILEWRAANARNPTDVDVLSYLKE